ncbi:hypothetical protein C7S20_00660 [Christiangramia fulva]|uniref:Glycosyltransferase 2-like domain-containing protein n=1 Tax=Christiangramia fulva TaxID=2126553 RepID=A0A2R3Z0V8_9FLAO|nr:glycosyltransferase family 2 protein [Christiangramia fulva]AVR43902.1 hypothetical protein C7S20_00660 [Christiangramia fulva]
MNDLVSIIIPTFNRAHFLRQSLASVKNQTYPNWECLVVDDGSQDETEAMLREISEKDSRFCYLKRPSERKKGAACCRNIGLEKSKGNFIQYLDSDDTIAPDKLAVHVGLLKQKDEFSMATCKWGRFYSKSDKVIVHEQMPTYFSTRHPIELLNIFGNTQSYLPVHSYFITSALSEKAGKWNEHLSNNDDGEYFTRIILNSSSIHFTNKTSVLYRAGANERLSNLEKRDQVKSYIRGWKIIDKTLSSYIKKNNHSLVKYAAGNLYDKLKNSSNKDLLEKEKEFFSKKRNTSSHYFLKLLYKLKIWKPLRKISL